MDITQQVLQHLPKNKKTPNGINICCPMCISMGELRNDTRFRGGFKLESDGGFVYHCFNCNFSTRWVYNSNVSKNLENFLNAIGVNTHHIDFLRMKLLKRNEKIEIISKNDQINEYNEIKLPNGCKSFEYWIKTGEPTGLFIQAYEYLISRGNTIVNGSKYYWSPKSILSINQRIVIPFFYKNKLVGYSARRFTNNDKISKYYGEKPSNYLFNQDLLDSDVERIILVEGVLDAISIKSVACLGNTLTDKQVDLLNSSNKEIIVVPDRLKQNYIPNWKHEKKTLYKVKNKQTGKSLIEYALENNWNVSIADWDEGIGDCAEAVKKYGMLYTLESIFESATLNKNKIESFFGLAGIRRWYNG